MNYLNIIITVASSSIVTFVLSIAAFKYDLIKIKANTSSEVSKSDQDKITTAEKTIELVEKLRLTMDRQFEEMTEEITSLKKVVNEYKIKCGNCKNNQ